MKKLIIVCEEKLQRYQGIYFCVLYRLFSLRLAFSLSLRCLYLKVLMSSLYLSVCGLDSFCGDDI